MKKLFALGCSFTRYCWPMWAELLAQEYDETYNLGMPGGGNQIIFYKLMSLTAANAVSKDDTVIIQWTEPLRNDYMVDRAWQGLGIASAEEIVRNNLAHTISKETVNIKQLSAMSAVIQILENIGCRWYFMFLNKDSMVHKDQSLGLHGSDVEFVSNLFQHINSYKEHFVDEIAFMEYLKQFNLKPLIQVHSGGSFHDDHPTPEFTAKYLSEIVSKVIQINDIDKIVNLTKILEKFISKPKYYQEKVTERINIFLQSSHFKTTIAK